MAIVVLGSEHSLGETFASRKRAESKHSFVTN